MPVVQRFPGCVVRIYSRDHPPPHFHVLLNDGREAVVDLHMIRIVRGAVDEREILDVLTWARDRQMPLVRIFEELQR